MGCSVSSQESCEQPAQKEIPRLVQHAPTMCELVQHIPSDCQERILFRGQPIELTDMILLDNQLNEYHVHLVFLVSMSTFFAQIPAKKLPIELEEKKGRICFPLPSDPKNVLNLCNVAYSWIHGDKIEWPANHDNLDLLKLLIQYEFHKPASLCMKNISNTLDNSDNHFLIDVANFAANIKQDNLCRDALKRLLPKNVGEAQRKIIVPQLNAYACQLLLINPLDD